MLPGCNLAGIGRMPLDARTACLYTHAVMVTEAIPSRVFMNGNSQAVRIPALPSHQASRRCEESISTTSRATVESSSR